MSAEPFEFIAHDQNVWEIVLRHPLLPALMQHIVQYIDQRLDPDAPPVGLLVDARSLQSVSVVRLSALVDTLSRFHTPLAVVLAAPKQLELANLLHNTLTHRGYVAYFLEAEDAWDHLLGQQP